MTPQPPDQPPAPSLGVGDILFIVFRHKWKIIIFSLLGIVAAGGIWFTKKPLFESSARILVKYVTDTKTPIDASQAQVRSPDVRGDTIINSEIAILTSGDSIVDAVRSITPQRVLAAYGGGTNVTKAAELVARNFDVGVGKNSSVMELALRHPDAQVAQDLLKRLIQNYQRKHLEVHRAGAAYDDLQQQTENLRTRLALTEQELQRAMKSAGVIDMTQAKQESTTQIASLRKSIYETEAALAEQRARLQAYNPALLPNPTSPERSGATNQAPNLVATVPPAELSPETNVSAVAAASHPSSTDLARYQLLSDKLAALRAEELNLILSFKEGSKKVLQHRQQITEVEQSLKALGIDPATIAPKAAASTATASLPRPPSFDSEAAIASIRALEAKFQTLTNQLAREDAKYAQIESAENLIDQLERRKKLEEDQFTYYARSLEQARLDQALDATKLNNINVLQEPSAGAPAADKKIKKLAGGALAGGFGLGFGLAFLLDLLVDPSVKRRKDIESNLKLPVLATIPHFGRNGHSQLKVGKNGETSDLLPAESSFNGEIPPWEEADPMLPYYEALRDRVVMSYGEDMHKPKIVGLTSCEPHVGVTRLATGLAAALSRDVQRDVLLIGLQKNQVSVSAFAKGRPASERSSESSPSSLLPPPSSLESSATDDEQPTTDHRPPTTDCSLLTTDNGPLTTGSPPSSASHPSSLNLHPSSLENDLSRNLESLVTTGRNLAGASVVQSFSDLMPRLKVSDYDYIIFDLPPVTQTSGSIRLATQMERTLLVVEAEKTSKDKVKSVRELLARSKTQLATVLNKTQCYGPQALRTDD